MSLGKNLNIGSKKKEEKTPEVKEPQKEEIVEKEATKEEVIEPVVEQVQVVKEEPTELTEEKQQMMSETAAAVQSLDEKAIDRINSPDLSELAAHEHMLIVFPLGDEEYAISIDDVKEVVPMPPIALIPQVPEYILGVANVRGNVMAIVDLATKFSLVDDKEVEAELGNYVLVVKNEEHSIAVNVSAVPNTMMVSDNEIDSPGNIINHTALSMNHIKGIVKKDKRMIVWIDIQEVIAQIEVEES